MSANRGVRRYRNDRICTRRQRVHFRWTHYNDEPEPSTGDGSSPCHCEQGPGVWNKRRPLSCGCTKRRPGQPKIANGMCDSGARNRIYRWRKQARDLRNLSRYEVDWESDEVSLMASPVIRQRD